jgi:hypothetical protein
MRALADASRIGQFMEALADAAGTASRVYFTGGVSAVLLGWRSSTVDVDLKLVPDSDDLLRAIPRLKEKLSLNVELASPDHFIPEVPGWRERSVLIRQIKHLSFLHYDFYSQALSKLERRHVKDLLDAEEMLRMGLVERAELLRFFTAIEPELYRYPAVDPLSFRAAVEQLIARP